MAASSIHSIFTVSRDHIDEGPKNTNERPRVSFAKLLKSRGRHEDGRKLESLHFLQCPVTTSMGAKARQKKKRLS